MTEFSCCKLEIFIPESHLPVLQQALREADAGHIRQLRQLSILQPGYQLLAALDRE